MKKSILAVLAVIFMAVPAFADVKLRLGVNAENYKVEDTDGYSYNSTITNIRISGEYMFNFSDVFKAGAGIQARIMIENCNRKDYEHTESWLPIYATAQLNPFSNNKELFFKLNIGYSPMYSTNYKYVIGNKKGGMYWGIGTGYEFPSGLFFDVMYESYFYSMSYETYDRDKTDGSIVVGLGYKFKI